MASAEIIEALSGVNAILSLANSSIGQVITAPLLENGELLRLSSEVVRPFYLKKSRETMKLMDEAFAGLPYSIHVSEGSIFLWLWFKDLPRQQHRTLPAPEKTKRPGYSRLLLLFR